jgi:cytochrome b6
MGGLAFWMFLLEAFTGALLALFYLPSAGGAYLSVQAITHIVPYGFFIRNLHYWCGQIMVAAVALHMVRVFLTGSFAAPRHFNWIIGLLLLVGTIFVDFTGYLLVWDDRGLWAWTIARNLTDNVPLVGPLMSNLLFGPEEAGDFAILRVYAWHVIFLPSLLIVTMLWHFWKIRRDGGISQPL